MRLDEVYGTLAAFTDEELRAFIDADRLRRSAVERAADQVFLGWLVRLVARDPLTQARDRASAALQEAGLPEPHPTRAATRGILTPLIALVTVLAGAVAIGTMLIRVLPVEPADRAAIGDAWLSVGLGAGALLAAVLARRPLRHGPRDPADVFGHRLQDALAAMYAITAMLALLPQAFIAIVMAMPDMADLATVLLAVTALALTVAGLRAGLRTRALSGVWRPFEDAALAAVAHGWISDLDERLLAQPLDAVVRRAGGR